MRNKLNTFQNFNSILIAGVSDALIRLLLSAIIFNKLQNR